MCKELKKELVGLTIDEVFSQSKDELIISLSNDRKESFIKAHLSSRFCCLSFPRAFSRARKNSVDLFTEIIACKVLDVCQIENDRSFFLQLDHRHRLLFKMHGNRSNVILFHQENVLEIFRKKLHNDLSININDLSKNVNIDKQLFEKHNASLSDLIPTFGNSFNEYFNKKDFDKLVIDEQYNCLSQFIDYLDSPKYFIHHSLNKIPQLSLYQKSQNDLKFMSPIEAINVFFRKYIIDQGLAREKREIKTSIEKQINRIDSYIQKSSSRHKTLENSANYKHIGDVIIANLHVIKPYTSHAELIDFITHKPIRIQLKPNLTPQLNAEKYYQKAKRQQIEIDTLNRNIESKKKQKTELVNELKQLENYDSLKLLTKHPNKKKEQDTPPYHMTTFMGFDILIGKNASKNELLSFGIAKKGDLFLHAKNSPGSHVIVRKKNNQNFPKPVIEKAASFAAYYSKSKSDQLCSVLYTPKKYVRKSKGHPPGTVIIEKEKVILVKPCELAQRKN